MKCPTCGKQTKGVEHNNRGRRCTACWARLPDLPAQAGEPPRPKRRRKPKTARTSAEAVTLEATSPKPTPQTA